MPITSIDPSIPKLLALIEEYEVKQQSPHNSPAEQYIYSLMVEDLRALIDELK